MDTKDAQPEKSTRKEKREGTTASPKSRPGPAANAPKRLDNIETIRSGAKLQPVDPVKQSLKQTAQTREEKAVMVATLHDVTQVMTAANITEEDLWEGKTDLFPIILHYGSELIAAAMASEDFCILEIKFPNTPEFGGIPSKLYKCDPFWTVHHTVTMVCKRFGIAESKAYSLATVAGFSLQDSEPLASFGLGSLLPRWQLVLQQREGKIVTRMDTIKAYKAAASKPSALSVLSPSLSSISTSSTGSSGDPRASSTTKKKSGSHRKTASTTSEERYPVLILLDSNVFRYKSQRVHVRGTSSIQDLLDAICRTHSISPTTIPLLVSTVNGTILDKSGVLADYGLGKRFQRWQLKIYAGEAASSMILKSAGKYAWTQIDESNLQPGEAKRLILELEKKLERTRRQAVKDSSSSSAGGTASSVALKTFTKMETELGKMKDAKMAAEKAAAAAELLYDNQIKLYAKTKSELDATITRLRDEREEYQSKARDLEKQISADKQHYEAQVAQQKSSINDTLKKLSNSTKSSRRSAAQAFDAAPSKSSSSVKLNTSSKDAENSPESNENTSRLAEAHADLALAQSEILLLKKEMEHQKKTLENTITSLKAETDAAKTETSKLRTKLADMNASAVASQAELDTLTTKIKSLLSSLELEKLARRDAIEKIVELEQHRAMDEEARIDSLLSKLEAEHETRYADLLATNRDLYSGIEEMRQQLLEAGRERDELRALLEQSSAATVTRNTASGPSSPLSPPPPPAAPAPLAPAPAPPSISGLMAQATKTRAKSKPQRQDSVFLGLTMASRIEQGRSKLRAVNVGPAKKTYSSDLEAALHRRFLAMSSDLVEELSDEEGTDSDDNFENDDGSFASTSSRSLFDLKL